MIQRMVRAAKLDPALYEEVEHDRGAAVQALAVVLLVSVVSGLPWIAEGGAWGLVAGAAAAVIGWSLWALITYFVGTTLFRTPDTEADWGQLARTLGFAQSPGLLRVFAIIPLITWPVLVVTAVWQLAAMLVAVRQALDYRSTWRAVGVVVVGFIPYMLVIGLVGALTGA